MSTLIETRYIKLPKGETLELGIYPGFLDKVRKHFGLADTEPVDDEYLRMFVYGATKGAVDKAERELTKDERPKENTG